MAPIKRVAVIGTGPAGVIAIDALAQEKAFDVIRVFERREAPGGCWLEDTVPQNAPLPSFAAISSRSADTPLTPPETLPSTAPASEQHRFVGSSIYPALETNIHAETMEYSQEPIPTIRSEISVQRHGTDTPFRPFTAIKSWVTAMVERENYNSLVSYNTTVELVQKDEKSNTWILTLRKPVEGTNEDYWWTETFDAVLVASGHYIVPYIPAIPGLAEFAELYPGAVKHSKEFRDRESYRGKNVVVVGASISGADIAFSLAGVAAVPLTAVIRGKYHVYFKDYAFQHPNIVRRPTIIRVETDDGKRTVVFEDGTTLQDVDNIIFGTGYSWTLPFLPQVEVKNNRVPGLYQHIFWQKDPTLCFVGAVAAGFTFKIFEWQAVLAARYLAGRHTLPPIAQQIEWEEERIRRKGDGVPFTTLHPDIEDEFEVLRQLAGEPAVGEDGKEIGRKLPKFDPSWMDAYLSGHEKRIQMWKNGNAAARRAMQKQEIDIQVKTTATL